MDSLMNVDWSKAETFPDEDISYYLYLEGKSPDAISRIRNINKESVRSHIINGKIKYGILAKCKDIDELFCAISSSPKADKLGVLNCLSDAHRSELLSYINEGYSNMRSREKETAVWILGELKLKEGWSVLKKASVHNHVNIRRMAVSAMGKIGSLYFEAALIKALDDENPQVVSYSIKALDKLESKSAADKIERIFENSDKNYLKEAAGLWLEKRSG